MASTCWYRGKYEDTGAAATGSMTRKKEAYAIATMISHPEWGVGRSVRIQRAANGGPWKDTNEVFELGFFTKNGKRLAHPIR